MLETEKYEAAKLLLEDGDKLGSLSLFKELAEQNYLNSSTYVGFILMNIGEPNQAIEYLRSAIALDNTGSAHFYLADILEERKDFLAALQLYYQAADLEVPAGYYRIGLHILSSGCPKGFDHDALYYFAKGASVGHVFCQQAVLKTKKKKSPLYFIFFTLMRLFWLLPKTLYIHLTNPNDERLRV